MNHSGSGPRCNPSVVSLFLGMCVGAWYDFWLGPPAFANTTLTTDIRGVLTYGHNSSDPIPTPQSTTLNITNTNCTDIDYSVLRQDPAFFNESYSVSLEDPSVTYNINYTFPVYVGTEMRTLVDSQLYTVNDSSIPTLYAIQQDPTWTPPSTEQRNILTIPDQYEGKNVRVVIIVTGNGTHPFHLHGHGFQMLASGTGSFNDTALAQVNSVDLRDTIVRDTAIVQGGGWTVIQYVFPPSRTLCNVYSHVCVFSTDLRPTIRVFGLCIVILVS